MTNKNRGKVNQPPTGEGKKQSTKRGAENKLDKRSEVVQAQHDRPDLNLGTDADEAAAQPKSSQKSNPKRPKAGR
jgi:hypothetical protein